MARTWPFGGRVPYVLSKLSVARPICLRLFMHCARAPPRGRLHGRQEERDQTAMIAITTSNSISVKPAFLVGFVGTETMFGSPIKSRVIKLTYSERMGTHGPKI